MKCLQPKSPLGESSDDLEEYFHSFFNLPKKDLLPIEQQIYSPGSEIFWQDDPADAVFFIEKGMVKLMRSVPAGSEIIIGIRRGPALIGGSAVLLGKPFFYRAVALVRTSLRSMPAEVFLHLVKTDLQFSLQTNKLLSQALYNCMNRLETVGCMPARERLEHFLTELILQEEGTATEQPLEFTIPLKSQEIARIIAVTPEHFCRLLKEIEEDGLIRRNKGSLSVINPAALIRRSRT